MGAGGVAPLSPPLHLVLWKGPRLLKARARQLQCPGEVPWAQPHAEAGRLFLLPAQSAPVMSLAE